MKDLSPDNLMVDPPGGWRYGFPKLIPKDQQHRMLEWIIENGYPRHIAEELGAAFSVRCWNAEPEA